jgi:S-adenosylmethionine synthetase
LRDAGAYRAARRAVCAEAEAAARVAAPGLEIDAVANAADDDRQASLFLTVTGTSAEQGDDGLTGRGNRVGGLITPLREMSLEAAAGKNPVSHVGKTYNVAAREAARALAGRPGVSEAVVALVSRIGCPLDEPQAVLVRVRAQLSDAELHAAAAECVAVTLARLPRLAREIRSGAHRLF